jgi:hypothetical protein
VAGVDFKDWFRKAISSTEELDYKEALDWFGLRFAPPNETEKKDATKTKELTSEWKLEVRGDASDTQKERLQNLLEPAKGQ